MILVQAKTLADLTKAIDNYLAEFWDDPKSFWYIQDEHGLFAGGGQPTLASLPTTDQQQAISRTYLKNYLLPFLRPLLQRYVQQQLRHALSTNVEQILKVFNRIHAVTIIVPPAPDDARPQGARVQIGQWTVWPGDDGTCTLRYTLYGYLKNTAPKKALLIVAHHPAVEKAFSPAVQRVVFSSATILKIHVTNKSTGTPLQGATITVAGRTALTDADGNATLAGLPLGRQRVSVTHDGFQPAGKTVKFTESVKVGRVRLTPVTVPDEQETEKNLDALQAVSGVDEAMISAPGRLKGKAGRILRQMDSVSEDAFNPPPAKPPE